MASATRATLVMKAKGLSKTNEGRGRVDVGLRGDQRPKRNGNTAEMPGAAAGELRTARQGKTKQEGGCAPGEDYPRGG